MLHRPLGRTGLDVSEIGFGCASYWGKPAFPERRAVALVHAALEAGVTFLDTGSSYARGEAEPRLGRALQGRDVSRLVIATKAGTRHASGGRIVRDFSPEAIVASVEASLRNLGLESLPLLQLHGPAVAELDAPLLETLQSLRERQLVQALGVNSFDPAVIEYAIGLDAIDVVMIDYSVLRPERAALAARAAWEGKGVLAGMALGMGHALGAGSRIRAPQDLWYAARGLVRHRGEAARGARLRPVLRDAARAADLTPAQAALAFVLADANVSCAVIGTTRQAHLAENLGASGAALPPGAHKALREALM